MDRKSEVLLLLTIILVLVSVWLTYDRTIIRKDFEVEYSETEDTSLESEI